MNKEELEIAKKIAEIEGVELVEHKGGFLYKNRNGYMFVNGVTMEWYNPFDWSVLGPLSVKYEVSIQHTLSYVFITQGWHDVEVHFENKDEIPHAILKCIIKAKEK